MAYHLPQGAVAYSRSVSGATSSSAAESSPAHRAERAEGRGGETGGLETPGLGPAGAALLDKLAQMEQQVLRDPQSNPAERAALQERLRALRESVAHMDAHYDARLYEARARNKHVADKLSGLTTRVSRIEAAPAPRQSAEYLDAFPPQRSAPMPRQSAEYLDAFPDRDVMRTPSPDWAPYDRPGQDPFYTE